MHCEKRILVVEDDFTIYPLLKRMIHRLNPDVSIEFADSAELAGDLLKEDLHNPRYTVVLSDVSLAGPATGLELVNQCTFEKIHVPFVLVSANRDLKQALPLLAKPFRYEEFYEKLSPYLEPKICADDLTAAISEDVLEEKPVIRHIAYAFGAVMFVSLLLAGFAIWEHLV